MKFFWFFWHRIQISQKNYWQTGNHPSGSPQLVHCFPRIEMDNLLSIPAGLEVRSTLKFFLSSRNHQMPWCPKMLQYGNKAKLLSFLIKEKENASGMKNDMQHWERGNRCYVYLTFIKDSIGVLTAIDKQLIDKENNTLYKPQLSHRFPLPLYF